MAVPVAICAENTLSLDSDVAVLKNCQLKTFLCKNMSGWQFKYRRPQTVFSYYITMSDRQFLVPLRSETSGSVFSVDIRARSLQEKSAFTLVNNIDLLSFSVAEYKEVMS